MSKKPGLGKAMLKSLGYVCHIVGCSYGPEFPVTAPTLCKDHRGITQSRVTFSPLLYWAMLWVMAEYQQRHLRSIYTPEKLAAGVKIDTNNRLTWTVEHLLVVLETGGFEQFLKAMPIPLDRIPRRELSYVRGFLRQDQMVNKSKRRVLSSYWRMIDKTQTSPSAIFKFQSRKVMVAYIDCNSKQILNVVEYLELISSPQELKSQYLALKGPWSKLFPPPPKKITSGTTETHV